MRKRGKYKTIDPDDIFLDSANLSNLNKQQFEGVLEKPVSSNAISGMLILFLLVGLVFFSKIGYLQIAQGEKFFAQSENNRLDAITIFSERGVIYDRNGTELAWNIGGEDGEFFYRDTIAMGGFAHLLGYVAYPKKDTHGFYWREEVVGQDGIEKIYDSVLAGENGQKIVEVDALMEPQSENTIKRPINGKNLVLTIDSSVQAKLFDGIKTVAERAGFDAGAGVIMDIETGELLALTSYPEYDISVLSSGDTTQIASYVSDSSKPFLNRAVSGLYTPGSTIKPFLAIGALEEGLIDETTTIKSVGRIEVENRYFPDQKSIFRDWRPEGHGITDVKWAIADSVNTFFYAIGGGYGGQEGLGIANIDKYLEKFQIGEKTGINFPGEYLGTIPSPQWKEEIFGERWYLGDTYITSIGQFGFQVSLLQMARGIGAIAGDGTLHTPRLTNYEKDFPINLGLDLKNLEIVKEGMRETVTRGTAQILNSSSLAIAAKTGTAQVGKNNEYLNSWVVGFFPYENPKYSFAIVMERGPRDNSGSASQAFRHMLDELMLDGFEW